METQIYSIQTVEEALGCIQAGADRIGVLVGLVNGPFPCAISEETAMDIFSAIGNKAVKVLISVQDNEADILAQTQRLKPDVLHLCTSFAGNPEFREKLRKCLPEVKLMEAVGVTGEESIEEAVKKAEYADIILLDSVSTSIPGIGAAGVINDWGIGRQIVEKVKVPVILAGGLGPDNVRAAIEQVKPFGVDSLTRTSVVKNGKILHKDIELVKQFCEAAKDVSL
ncbi:MAG: phosphoribosylanthranilate isomerase [Anaerolineae bacterium]|nr:phosphoribosylanthranilate isomerase [Anaerolineae bacterium]